MRVRHNPEKYGNFKKGNRRPNQEREESPSKTHATKEGRKLALSEQMKAALITVGLFSEEKSDVIVNDTQANLSVDL